MESVFFILIHIKLKIYIETGYWDWDDDGNAEWIDPCSGSDDDSD